MADHRTSFRNAAAAAAATALLACAPEGAPEAPLTLEGPTMGTSYRVTVPRPLPASAAALDAAVREELEQVDSLMSTYREDSELSRLNRHRSTDPFAVSRQVFGVLQAAQRVSATTSGAFDITVGPLVAAWGFGPSGAPEPPSEEEVERLRRGTGWRKLSLDAEAPSVTKAVPGLQCDLSAIAKGHAADRVAERLDALGGERYLVEIGGEIRARGTNPEGAAWRVGVERPDPAGRSVQRILRLRDTGVATSGDYRNVRRAGDAHWSHILDPRSGKPAASRVASATVLAPSAMRADALATAMLVLGERAGLALAEDEGLAVLLIVRDGPEALREASSSRFRARMRH